jgi:hypothetical protein
MRDSATFQGTVQWVRDLMLVILQCRNTTGRSASRVNLIEVQVGNLAMHEEFPGAGR